MAKYLDETGLAHFWENVKEAIGHVTPQMFGAMADGITDDLKAFEDMLEYAATNNTQAMVPAGSYVLSKCVFSDDSVIIADKGTYPSSRLIISEKIKDRLSPTLEKVIAVSQSAIISDGRVLQGACYDSTNEHIVMAFSNGDDATGYLSAYDSNLTAEVVGATVSAVSHFNDLTYNPNTHTIYTPARPTVDTIYTINPDTLAVTGSFSIDFGAIIKRFSYDVDNDVYFASGDDYIKVYDSSFAQIGSTLVASDIADLADETGVAQAEIIRQGSEVVNGQFLMLWTDQNSDNSSNFRHEWLTQWDYASGAIKQSYVFDTATGFDEPEAVFVMGGKLYVLSGYGRKLYLSSAYVDGIDESRNDPPADTNIVSGTDMNDIIRYGEYVCQTTAIATTLTNCPFASPFRLYVLKETGGNFLFQAFINHAGKVYVRYYRHDTGLWYERGEVEFVASSGTSNSWRYKVHPDGTMTAWISKSLGSVSSWTASGSLYYSPEFTVPLPAFTGTISSYDFQASANQQCYVSSPSISGTDLKFRLFGPITDARNVTVRLRIELVLI